MFLSAVNFGISFWKPPLMYYPLRVLLSGHFQAQHEYERCFLIPLSIFIGKKRILKLSEFFLFLVVVSNNNMIVYLIIQYTDSMIVFFQYLGGGFL